jgi:hypothetical protein
VVVLDPAAAAVDFTSRGGEFPASSGLRQTKVWPNPFFLGYSPPRLVKCIGCHAGDMEWEEKRSVAIVSPDARRENEHFDLIISNYLHNTIALRCILIYITQDENRT